METVYVLEAEIVSNLIVHICRFEITIQGRIMVYDAKLST